MRVLVSVCVTLLSIAATAAAEPTPKAQAPRTSHDRPAKDAIVDLSQVSQEVSAPVPYAGGGPIAPMHADAMTQIGDTRMNASAGAGAAGRDVTLSVPQATAHTDRPAAGRRVQERMDSRRVLSAMESAFSQCPSHVSVATPAMTLNLKLSVTPTGEVESAAVLDANAPGELAACVVTVGNTARFRAPGGVGASLVIPVSLPAHGFVSQAAAQSKPSTSSR